MQIPRSSIGVCNIESPQTGLEAKVQPARVGSHGSIGRRYSDVASYTDERVTRPELGRLSARVQVTPRDDLGSGVSVTLAELTDGRRLREECDTYLPVTDLARQRESLSKKFRGLTTPLLGDGSAIQVQEMVLKP